MFIIELWGSCETHGAPCPCRDKGHWLTTESLLHPGLQYGREGIYKAGQMAEVQKTRGKEQSVPARPESLQRKIQQVQDFVSAFWANFPTLWCLSKAEKTFLGIPSFSPGLLVFGARSTKREQGVWSSYINWIGHIESIETVSVVQKQFLVNKQKLWRPTCRFALGNPSAKIGKLICFKYIFGFSFIYIYSVLDALEGELGVVGEEVEKVHLAVHCGSHLNRF